MNKIYFFITTLISLPIFTGEAPFDLAGTPELFTPLSLAPGNGDAIIQAEWEIAEMQQKEAALQAALQAEKERPKRMVAGAIKSVISRTKYDKEKDGEYCSPCCQWVSFYACYGVFVVISAGISIFASFPTFPRDDTWCLQNVSPCTMCNGNTDSFTCFPASPLCPPHYKQL